MADLRYATTLLAAILATALVAFFIALPAAEAKTTVKEHRDALMTEAKQHLGTKYVYGGRSVCKVGVSMDCTCFTRVVYNRATDYTLPDSMVRQVTYAKKHGRKISRKNLKRGDLVFFDKNHNGRWEPWDHVALYIGDGNVMHASSYLGKVVVSKMKYAKGYAGAYRLPPTN